VSAEGVIYHIAAWEAWDEALRNGRYAADSLETDGFIHLSGADQVIRVANVLFPGRTDLVLLVVDPDRLSAEMRYENTEGGDERFPHLYGALEVAAVVDTLAFRPAADGTFSLPRGVV
jgi:uncharacterized protein (DUF952 family)